MNADEFIARQLRKADRRVAEMARRLPLCYKNPEWRRRKEVMAYAHQLGELKKLRDALNRE